MGFYLNSKKARSNYQEIVNSAYFVDKTLLLKELIPIAGQGNTTGQSNKYICITRPRRFGKTVMANMVTAYFVKGVDSRSLFDGLAISTCSGYKNHLNQHNVIFITLSEIPDNCQSYEQYISRIKKKLMSDLMRSYPDAEIDPSEPLWDAFNTVFELKEIRFIFVLDEWDFLFHRDFAADRDKSAYISFLSTLLKDQPYVEMAYMTGILPITKYSSGSELNMFLEYTMASEEKYCEYFGFTEEETNWLYEKYLGLTENPRITREELGTWYDGYHTRSGRRLYNPRSVISALINNNLGNYWTSSGPYDEILYYIRKNVDDVRDDIAVMVSGGAVPVKIREYAASSMNLDTKEEIFSAMVVYGFLRQL